MTSMQPRNPEVLITAGGTIEPIDGVRYIGNFSGGRLGHALAAAYAELGHQVLLLAPNSVVERLGLPEEGVTHQPFTSAESLRERMHAVDSAELVLHAAAVADYTPLRQEGKISSDQQELVLRLKRTPKILPTLRDHFGRKTKIFGFKLLSRANVDEAGLIEAAVKQITACQTDGCVANLLEDIEPRQARARRVYLVEPGGEYRAIKGDTLFVARSIAKIIGAGGS